MEWEHKGSVPAVVVLGDDAPAGAMAESWEAEADDGCRLEAAALGNGSAPSPFIIHTRCYAPADDMPARFPTLEEVQSAVNQIALRGAIMSMGVVQSAGPDAEPVAMVGWAGVMTMQIGGAENTPASARLKLTGGITPGQGVPRA